MMVYEIDPSITISEALRSDSALAQAAGGDPWSCLEAPSRLSQHQTPQEQILVQRFVSGDRQRGTIEFLFDVSNCSPFPESQPDKRY